VSEDPGLIGDNSGAVASALLAEAREAAKSFTDRRTEFVTTMEKYVAIRDRVDVGNAGDLIALARRVFENIDARRKAIIGPHDTAVVRVNAFFRDFWQPVADQVAALQERLDGFAEAERLRIKAQKDEQRQFEAAARGKSAAPAPAPADPGARKRAEAPVRRQNVRGDLGGNVVFGEKDVIEIEDWRQLPNFIMDAADVREAIVKVARPMVKQKVVIPGLKVTKAAATSVRR
jgi:hypothetical protein